MTFTWHLCVEQSIAPYCFGLFVFWVLFAFLVVKRVFLVSFSDVFCRRMSGKVVESLVNCVAAEVR
jgi:hypothetical protein